LQLPKRKLLLTFYARVCVGIKLCRQFARSGQISEFHIFAPANAAPCTVPPGADAPVRPSRFPPPLTLQSLKGQIQAEF